MFGVVKGLFKEREYTPSYVVKYQKASNLPPDSMELSVLNKMKRLKYYAVVDDSAILIEPFYSGNSMKILFPGCKPLSDDDYSTIKQKYGLESTDIQNFQTFIKNCYSNGISVEKLKENFDHVINKEFDLLEESFKEQWYGYAAYIAGKTPNPDIDELTEKDLKDYSLAAFSKQPIEYLKKLLEVTSFDSHTTIDIIIAITTEVDKLHELGFCHNDLNPGNVILQIASNKEGETICTAKLIDFGTCTDINNNKPSQSFFGSLRFSAPEALVGVPFTDPERILQEAGLSFDRKFQDLNELQKFLSSEECNLTFTEDIRLKSSKYTSKTDAYCLAKALISYVGLTKEPWSQLLQNATKLKESERVDLKELLLGLKLQSQFIAMQIKPEQSESVVERAQSNANQKKFIRKKEAMRLPKINFPSEQQFPIDKDNHNFINLRKSGKKN